MWSKTSVWNDYCVLFCRKLNGIFLNMLQDWRSYRFLTNWFSIRWQKCWSVLYCNSQHNQFIHKIFDSTCTSCRQNWNKPKEMLEKKMFICMEVCTYRADWCMLPKYELWRKIAGKSLEHVCHSCQSWKCFEVTTMNKITSNSTKHAILNDVLSQISILFSSQETSNKKNSLSIVTFSYLLRYSWFSTKLDFLRCFLVSFVF